MGAATGGDARDETALGTLRMVGVQRCRNDSEEAPGGGVEAEPAAAAAAGGASDMLFWSRHEGVEPLGGEGEV
jgi:hypothetical protein